MNEEEFEECSVVAYPHEIRFLHIKGGRISYYVDRHISDYVNKMQRENEKLKKQLEAKENQQKEFIENLKQQSIFYDNNGVIQGIINNISNKV